jgi:serine/threonine-protein kinase
MSKPPTLSRVLKTVRQSKLVDETALDTLLAKQDFPSDPTIALQQMVKAGLLTKFHAHHLLQGRYKGFTLGPYKILRPIGQGGVGLVYLAEHSSLKRRVAIKVIRSDMEDDEIRQRFSRESRAAASLDHPNLVRVHDFCTENGTSFLVMEYVRGQSFEEIIKRRGRLPVPEAIGYLIQAAKGLAHAHSRSIVHRDIKPSNIIVDADSVVKILDLGLVRFVDHRADDLTERLGGTGILGSPDYIAPEQALNKPDERSDIYSLGATLYFLLLGEPPFNDSRSRSGKLMAHQLNPVVPLHRRDNRIPEGLSIVVQRMLAKNPSDRFQTVDAVIDALHPFTMAIAPPPVAQATTQPTPTRVWWREWPALTVAVVGVVLALSLGVWIMAR